MMIKLIESVRLSGTIGVFSEASVLAIGNDIVVTDVLKSGKFRYRQVLENVSPEDVDFDAPVLIVSKAVRRKLHHLFDNEPVKRGSAPHYAESSDHKVAAPGDFKPLVKKGDVLVADFGMSGTHYFKLSQEDLAWLAYDGLTIR